MTKCPACTRDLPLDSFYTGIYKCKDCHKAYVKDYKRWQTVKRRLTFETIDYVKRVEREMAQGKEFWQIKYWDLYILYKHKKRFYDPYH